MYSATSPPSSSPWAPASLCRTSSPPERPSSTASNSPTSKCTIPPPPLPTKTSANPPSLPHRVRGRPHYYSTKHEEYAIIKFSLDADLSSLFTWNTKQVFAYVTAEWPSSTSANTTTNQAVIWDTIITAPSSDYLGNYGPATLRKLRKSAAGKSIDPSRYATPPLFPIPPGGPVVLTCAFCNT